MGLYTNVKRVLYSYLVNFQAPWAMNMGPKLRKNAPWSTILAIFSWDFSERWAIFCYFWALDVVLALYWAIWMQRVSTWAAMRLFHILKWYIFFSDFGTFWLFSTSTIHSIYTYNTFSKCSTTQSLPSLRTSHWN